MSNQDKNKKVSDKTMLNFQIDRELVDKGKELAEERGISLSGMMRQLLIKELKAEGKME